MFSMAVLFNLTRNMEPFVSFSIASATIFAFGIIIVIFTKELKPDIRASATQQTESDSYRLAENI